MSHCTNPEASGRYVPLDEMCATQLSSRPSHVATNHITHPWRLIRTATVKVICILGGALGFGAGTKCPSALRSAVLGEQQPLCNPLHLL